MSRETTGLSASCWPSSPRATSAAVAIARISRSSPSMEETVAIPPAKSMIADVAPIDAGGERFSMSSTLSISTPKEAESVSSQGGTEDGLEDDAKIRKAELTIAPTNLNLRPGGEIRAMALWMFESSKSFDSMRAPSSREEERTDIAAR